MLEQSFLDYTSGSQRARVVTESWVANNGYCLACSSDHLIQTKANTQARDFECGRCGHAYELKSASRPFGKRVVDGAYASMLHRIETATMPSLLLLHYSKAWDISNLWVIHHLLLTPIAIERRNALAVTARRAGWVGCNINLSGIPPEGRIPIILSGRPLPKEEARASFAKTERLSHLSPSSRGWTAAVLMLLHELGVNRFTLADAYTLEGKLSSLYPDNHHVKAKIRQQLQVLRDAGLIRFETRGAYTFVR